MNKKLAICMAVMLTMPLHIGFKSGETNSESAGNVQTENNSDNVEIFGSSEVETDKPFTSADKISGETVAAPIPHLQSSSTC